MIRTCCCRQPWQLQIKIITSHFFTRFHVPTSFRNASSLVIFHQNAGCCSRSSAWASLVPRPLPVFNVSCKTGSGLGTRLRLSCHLVHWLCGWGHGFIINGEYTDFCIQCTFHYIFCKKLSTGDPGVFWLISLWLHGLQIWRSSSSKVVVGNGDLN